MSGLLVGVAALIMPLITWGTIWRIFFLIIFAIGIVSYISLAKKNHKSGKYMWIWLGGMMPIFLIFGVLGSLANPCAENAFVCFGFPGGGIVGALAWFLYFPIAGSIYFLFGDKTK
jgi:hypothetical protein